MGLERIWAPIRPISGLLHGEASDIWAEDFGTVRESRSGSACGRYRRGARTYTAGACVGVGGGLRGGDRAVVGIHGRSAGCGSGEAVGRQSRHGCPDAGAASEEWAGHDAALSIDFSDGRGGQTREPFTQAACDCGGVSHQVGGAGAYCSCGRGGARTSCVVADAGGDGEICGEVGLWMAGPVAGARVVRIKARDELEALPNGRAACWMRRRLQ